MSKMKEKEELVKEKENLHLSLKVWVFGTVKKRIQLISTVR